jgi:HPt (histidine-containing phosphotransfer) domain-containing protein
MVLNPDELSALRAECIDGTEDHFPHYVSIFREDAAEVMAELASAESNGSADQLRRAAHRLRGGAANFGAFRLVRLCTELEKHAAGDRVRAAGALIPEVRNELARVERALERELHVAGAAAAEETSEV